MRSATDPDGYCCKFCTETVRASRGNRVALRAHVEKHRKQDELIRRDRVKSWLIAVLNGITVLNIPCSVFNSVIMKCFFYLAKLGPINDKIARSSTDAEAEYVKPSRETVDKGSKRRILCLTSCETHLM